MAETLQEMLDEEARAKGAKLTPEEIADVYRRYVGGGGSDPNTVTGDPVPNYLGYSDPTPVRVRQPMGLGPGGGYMPAMQYEIFENPAEALTNTKNSQAWINQLQSNNPEGYRELIGYLRGANYLSDRPNPLDTTVADAARRALTDAGAKGEEFYSFLNSSSVSGLRQEDDPSGGSTGVGRAPRLPSRTERVDLTNEMDANVILNNAMREAVGRDATEQEVSAFTQLLNGQAAENPLFSQNTPVGLTDAKTKTGGGINRELLAAEFADGTPGAKEYKMATEGVDAVEDWFAKRIGLF